MEIGGGRNDSSLRSVSGSKVTVLTPCYNAEKFLPVWADCILKQDYDNVQVIAINDGSTDGTEKSLLAFGEKFRAKGYDFLYLKKENGGAPSAINMALPYAIGEYLMPYDTDDILMPEAVSAKARFLDAHPDYGMVRNNGYYVYEDNLEDRSALFITQQAEKNNEHIFDDLIYARTNNWPGSYMVRCNALFGDSERSVYVSRWGHNLQFMAPVAYRCKSGFVDRPLMCYVIRKNSDSHVDDYEKTLIQTDTWCEIRKELLRSVGVPEEQRQRYEANLDVTYYHVKLRLAVSFAQRQDVQAYYKKLKAAGALTGRERVYILFAGGQWSANMLARLLAFRKRILHRP